ncbi:MAG: hypothetical protein NXH75_07770, partial [Halobacteriovoraceae bacterium]|nr:hypothetical protein [Halobacteriovoraceae bacterium]
NGSGASHLCLLCVCWLGDQVSTCSMMVYGCQAFLIYAFFLFFDGKTLIQPTIHEMLLSSELLMTQLLDGEMKDDFHAVWIHFFKEVDQKLIYERDKIYLLKRLEELNLSWNTYHMKMTKGNHDVPKNIVSLIKIMHNRWNSCLKIVLR